MPYTKTQWKNKQAPAINQGNLNKIEQGLEDALVTITDHINDGQNPHGVSAVQINADSAQTAADRVQTGLDRVATGEDRVVTNADVVLTNADAVSTAADRVSVAADLVQTDLDTIATAADRVQTGLDRTAVSDDKAAVVVLKGNVDDVLYQVTEDRVVTLAARDLAEKWASEAEDVEVIVGEYSAFHWAEKSKANNVPEHEATYDHPSYDSHLINISNPHTVTTTQIGAEPAFTKNTAFNKDFGAVTDTVTQGDDARLSDDRVPLVHASDKHSDAYQEPLVSGVNIKTISGNSLLGSVNIEVELETGFSTNDTVVQVYDPIARTVTLSGIGKMYFKGADILDVSLGYVSPPHPDTVGGWFHWYDGTDYVWTPYPWPFKDAGMIIYVNYGAVDRFGIREVHGQLPWEAHQEFHEQIGTYRRSGGDVTVVTGSAVTADKQPTVTQTILADEDLPSTLPALGKGTYTHFYLTGAGDVAFSLNNIHITNVDGGSGRIQYNQNNGGTWQFTTINVNNNFHVVYLVGIPTTSDAISQAYRYVFFQGQQLYSTLATAQEATFEQLDTSTFALLASEWTVLEKFILRSSNTNNGWTVQQNERVVTNRAQALIGGAGVTSHTLLEDRDALDQHPQSAITGLVSDLAGKSPTNHDLINITHHPVTDLTAGHYVRATGATTYAFAELQAADVTGTLDVANGGTGQSTYTNGQLLIGNTTGNTLAKTTLTQGVGITITNGAGSITIASDIDAGVF